MLGRMALRMLTLMALTNARATPYPTLAGNEIHDSAIRMIDQSNASDDIALVTVYTDESSNSNQRGGADYEAGQTTCRLTIELAFAIKESTNDAMGLRFPETEPELEAKLDLLESQIITILFHQNTIWARGWRNLVVQAFSMSSTRVHTDDGGVKLAIRQLAIELAILPDCPPSLATSAQLPYDISDVIAATPTATQEQRDVLSDRISAARQIPMPLQKVVLEIEKANWVREVLGQTPIQEAEAMRAQLLSNAPHSPFKAIQDNSDDANISSAWQAYVDRSQYLTEVRVHKTHGEAVGFDLSPNILPVEPITPMQSENGFGSWSVGERWSYTLDTNHAKVVALGDNETLDDYFNIVNTAGVTTQIKITIFG